MRLLHEKTLSRSHLDLHFAIEYEHYWHRPNVFKHFYVFTSEQALKDFVTRRNLCFTDDDRCCNVATRQYVFGDEDELNVVLPDLDEGDAFDLQTIRDEIPFQCFIKKPTLCQRVGSYMKRRRAMAQKGGKMRKFFGRWV